MSEVYAGRLDLLRKRLAALRVRGLLLTRLPNIFYLCGFSGDSGALLVNEQNVTLFTDGRFQVQARQELKTDANLVISRGPMATAIGKSLQKCQFYGRAGKLKVGFEAGHVTVAEIERLRGVTRQKVRWVPLAGIVEGLRAVKSAEEIARIRKSAHLTCSVLSAVLPLLKPGVREFEIAAEIEYQMRRKGAEGAAFDTIVAFGARSALPHARPTARKLGKNELVVLDLGAILAGYCSDLTRTVCVGKAPARVKKWYNAVRRAQKAAIAAARPGVAAGDVDGAARRVLRNAGVEKYFVHSTGHGLGLEIHEEPRLARRQQQRLQLGNVITIEPGVYVEGIGGIRIEDDVAVHSDRAEILTDAPRGFLEL